MRYTSVPIPMNCLRICLGWVLLLFFSALASAQSGAVDGSWRSLDLGNLRARETADKAPRPKDLPVGRTLVDGVPMLYADASGPWRLIASGQRISIAPHEGGRYYELAVAGRCDLTPDTLLEWELLGVGEKRTIVRARLVRGTDRLHRLILAANFPLHGLRLPKNPALEVHAISLRWVADGPGDVRFARAFLEQSRGDREMARYLRHTAPGGLIADAGAGQNRLRELFDALLAGDEAAAQGLLAERLSAIDARSATSKQDRVHLCLTLPPERAGDARELAQLARALQRWPDLRAAVGGSNGWRALERSQPDLADVLRAAAREGRLELAGWQGQLIWPVLPDGTQWHSDFDTGRAWVQARDLGAAAHPGLIGDPAAQPAFVDACLAAQRFRAMVWTSAGAPRVFSLRGTSGKAIAIVSVPPARTDFTSEDALALLGSTADECGAREALLMLALPVDEAQLVKWVQRVPEWTEAPEGPTYLWSTPSGAFDALKRNPEFRAPTLTALPSSIWLAPALANYELRMEAEQRRVARESAWRAASFAHLDGLRVLRRLLDDPQTSLEQLEQETQSALAVLARAANTQGDGEPLLVYNLLSHERAGVVTVEARPGMVPVDERGSVLPSARDAQDRLIFRAQVQSLGQTLYRLVEGQAAAAKPAVGEADGRWSSARLTFRVEPSTGELTSLRVLPEGVELLGGASNRLIGMEGDVQTTVTVLENNPVRLVLSITREASNARIDQEFILEADAPDLRLRTQVTRLSKGAAPRLAFTWREGSDRARVEMAGGEALLPLEGRGPGGWLAMRRFLAGVHGSLGLGLVRVAQGRAALTAQDVRLELNGRIGASEELLLRPYLEGGGQVRLALAAEELASPLRVVRTDAHNGVRDGRLSFLTCGRLAVGGQYTSGDRSGIALESLRTGDAPGLLELSFRENLGEGGELEIALAARVFAVERWDAERGEWKAIRHERGKVRAPIAPLSMLRLRLKLRP